MNQAESCRFCGKATVAWIEEAKPRGWRKTDHDETECELQNLHQMVSMWRTMAKRFAIVIAVLSVALILLASANLASM